MVRYVCHVCSMCMSCTSSMSCKYNVNNFLTNSILHDTLLYLSLLYSIFFNTCHVNLHVIFPRYYISSDTSTTTTRLDTSRYWYRIDIHL